MHFVTFEAYLCNIIFLYVFFRVLTIYLDFSIDFINSVLGNKSSIFKVTEMSCKIDFSVSLIHH